jgi:hypothetical protein
VSDAFEIDETDPIGSVLAPLIGLPAWSVKKVHGSILTFEFGTPHLYIREPRPIAELSTPNSPMGRQLQRRLVVPHGDWHLCVDCCHWRCSGIDQSTDESDESTDAEIIAAAKFMDGQRLMSVETDPAAGRSLFQFDLGAKLETWPYDDDDNDEQWCLCTPSNYWLSYRADGHYSWAAGDQPVDEQRWFPVPAGQPFGLMR